MQHLMTRLAGMRTKLASEKILLFLDGDGTLVPFSGAVHRLLAKLTRLHGVDLAFVSGRSLADLESEVNLKRVFYAGHHGLEVRGPNGDRLSSPGNVLRRGTAFLAPQACGKGAAVCRILTAVKRFRGPNVQCFYLGEDPTAEEAFCELGSNAVTVKVSQTGSEKTAARYFLRNVHDVFAFLQKLYQCRVEKDDAL